MARILLGICLMVAACGRSSLPRTQPEDGADEPPPTFAVDLRAADGCNAFQGLVARASTGTYLGAGGVLAVARADEPRCDHEPNGASRGLLVEPASSNAISHSRGLSSDGNLPDGWGRQDNDATVVISLGSDAHFPDLTTVEMDATGTSGVTGGARLFFADALPVTPGDTWSISAWVRMTEGALVDRACGGLGVHFGNSGMYLSEVDESDTELDVQFPTAWQRLSVTFVIPAGVDELRPRYSIYCLDPGEHLVMQLVGPQLERGAIATSYIATTDAVAVRASETFELRLTDDVRQGAALGVSGEARSGLGVVPWVTLASSLSTSFARIERQVSANGETIALLAPRAGGATSLGMALATRPPVVTFALALDASHASLLSGSAISREQVALDDALDTLTLEGDGTAPVATVLRRLWVADELLSETQLAAELRR